MLTGARVDVHRAQAFGLAHGLRLGAHRTDQCLSRMRHRTIAA